MVGAAAGTFGAEGVGIEVLLDDVPFIVELVEEFAEFTVLGTALGFMLLTEGASTGTACDLAL